MSGDPAVELARSVELALVAGDVVEVVSGLSSARRSLLHEVGLPVGRLLPHRGSNRIAVHVDLNGRRG